MGDRRLRLIGDPRPACAIGSKFHTGGPYGYTATGGTGVPVRTLFAVLTDIAENG